VKKPDSSSAIVATAICAVIGVAGFLVGYLHSGLRWFEFLADFVLLALGFWGGSLIGSVRPRPPMPPASQARWIFPKAASPWNTTHAIRANSVHSVESADRTDLQSVVRTTDGREFYCMENPEEILKRITG
jgi:hypothetical protein